MNEKVSVAFRTIPKCSQNYLDQRIKTRVLRKYFKGTELKLIEGRLTQKTEFCKKSITIILK